MTLQELITTVMTIATPIAAAVVWIVTERRRAKKEFDKRQTDEAERERSYSERLTARLKSAEELAERLTKEITEERLKTGKYTVPADVLRDFIDNDPGISWVKRRMGPKNYQMIRVSLGYAQSILHEAPEFYDGKTDFEIWPKETAEQFTANDEKVHTSQEGIHLTETTPKGKFIGRKFPLRLNDGYDYVVGIGVFEISEKITKTSKK